MRLGADRGEDVDETLERDLGVGERAEVDLADVGKQQNLPLDYVEHIPRRDYAPYFLGVAAFSCFMLLVYRVLQLRSWT